MAKINWKQKLSSRKFWAALAGFVGAVAVVCGAGESLIAEALETVEKITVKYHDDPLL